METRSNHILVGAVVLALLAAVIGFTAWLAGRGGGPTKQYDIFFKQSVEGINKGSAVSFNGVASGSVRDIELWPEDPSLVRVRIAVRRNVPVLIGTTAAIQGVGFTGASQVVLAGAVKDAPEIIAPGPGPGSVPMIPTRTAGLGAILNNAPQLLERLSTLTERLTEMFSDKNQIALTNVLANVDNATRGMKQIGPGLDATFSEARFAIRQAAAATDRFAVLADNAGKTINQTGSTLNRTGETLNQELPALIGDLRKTVVAAETSLNKLDKEIGDISNSAKPGLNAISTKTVPEISQLVREMRTMSESLSSVAAKIDQQGLGTLISGPKLPDYIPAKEKK